jgi:hypothetical protein
MNQILGCSTKILAGALSGRKAFTELLNLTSGDPSQPTHVFLDFEGVEIATASYLRESVLNFRRTIRSRRSNWYPVVANCDELVVEELKMLVASDRDALMICTLDENDEPSRPNLIGELDPKQQVTFDLVKQLGMTDAAKLKHVDEKENIVQSAWNNRLTSLLNLGLIIEVSQGRAKSYRPLFAEDC